MSGAYARARNAFKAARFRASEKSRGLCSSAPLRGSPAGAAFEHAAFARGPWRPTKSRKVHGFKPKSKGQHMSKLTTPPSHRVYAVTKNGKQSYWRVIGAVWPHGDGEGFNLKLDCLPLNGAEIVIRKAKVDEADTADEAA
jgi:hypothetical protein